MRLMILRSTRPRVPVRTHVCQDVLAESEDNVPLILLPIVTTFSTLPWKPQASSSLSRWPRTTLAESRGTIHCRAAAIVLRKKHLHRYFSLGDLCRRRKILDLLLGVDINVRIFT